MRRSSLVWAYHAAVSLTILVSHFGKEVHAREPADNTPPSTTVYESLKFVSNQPEKRICLDDDDDDDNNIGSYTCTTRGEQLKLEEERERPYNLGVAQRMDGSDTEKSLIRDVISMMQQYFMDEVLSKPVYKDVRHNWYVR